MHHVLVSACLLGSPVRHDGAHKRAASAVLQRWLAEGRVVPVCPELAGGLAVPRAPAEIEGGAGGSAVLDGRTRVIDADGRDVSVAFVAGAEHALRQARQHGIRLAVLKEGSPSCGSSVVHGGRFDGTRIPGRGVAAALLAEGGIALFSEAQFDEADALLRRLEAAA
jgi:uncharacterized protein YbbK (DUF523 family)